MSDSVLLVLILLGAAAVVLVILMANQGNTTTRGAGNVYASLIAVAGPLKNQRFPLRDGVYHIGRAPDCIIVIQALFVSRHHAQIELRAGMCTLTDLDSMNGTYVDGKRIARAVLANGNQIQIGPLVLVYHQGGAITPSPEPVHVPVPPPPSATPARLSGNLVDYQITEKMPAGGHADVYKAIAIRDGHSVVAIKVLRNEDPYLVKHFKQEGLIQKRLDNPHIIKVFDYGQSGGRYYLIMEFADGGNLRKRLKPGQPLPLAETIDIIGQACEGLTCAHAQGVLHRDIKPENIMFSGRGCVKIVDFGIAQLAGASTQTIDGMLVGTPLYMSPEQGRGDDKLSGGCDIYSLGIVMYEMLTGRPPFTGELLTIVEQHIAAQPLPPRQINPNIPPAVEEITMRCLAKSPNQRFASASELAAALGYTGSTACSGKKGGPQPGQSTLSRATIAPAISGAFKTFGEKLSHLPMPLQFPVRTGALARLIIEQGTTPGRVIPVGQGITLLRRGDVDVNDLTISRQQHARIRVLDGQFILEHMTSSPGTWLNGRPLTEPTPLRSGDEIRIGRNLLRFHVP